MTETRLQIETRLPFAWDPAPAAADQANMQLGSRLLLAAVNQTEIVTVYAERGEPALERVEAKLDLMLHWLGSSLHGGRPLPGATDLRLDADGMEWRGSGPAAGEGVVLRLYLSPILVGPVQLPARAAGTADGWCRAEFTGMDEALADLWSQWLFRRHRRAIQAARESGSGE